MQAHPISDSPPPQSIRINIDTKFGTTLPFFLPMRTWTTSPIFADLCRQIMFHDVSFTISPSILYVSGVTIMTAVSFASRYFANRIMPNADSANPLPRIITLIIIINIIFSYQCMPLDMNGLQREPLILTIISLHLLISGHLFDWMQRLSSSRIMFNIL